MTVYYAATSQIETVDYSLDAGVTILDYFNTLFEVPYPQPNLGIFLIFFWGGGCGGGGGGFSTIVQNELFFRFVNYYDLFQSFVFYYFLTIYRVSKFPFGDEKNSVLF